MNGCNDNDNLAESDKNSDEKLLFETVSPKDSGLDFVNVLEETTAANYFSYMYIYIGGGVAAGDINNDGLIDLYFTSNLSPDKLYLNKGDFKFEDVTEKVGIKHIPGFNTGVTFADVNNDGFLDIYVSRGGWQDEDAKFENLLYINNGDLTFSEKGKELGLADANRTIQTTFFDYDNDNDLDAYVSNAPMEASIIKTNLELDYFYNNPRTLLAKGSDRLYENNGNGHFVDVSEKAGLVYDLGHGLNPMVADLNGDQWLDIYVSNDFDAPDLVYINNGDKTFTESGAKMFKHMSLNSMGNDVADINNDGFPDLMTLDMNPEDYIRSKTTMGMTPLSEFEDMVRNGYHYQYMHNMLQMNNGNGTFSEIGNLAGIANTDWSWSLMMADFDLDGYNDVYVTNGIFRDVIDRDKNAMINKKWSQNGLQPTPEQKLQYCKMLPQQKLENYFFKNNGDLTFSNTTSKWSTTKPTFSNGSAYADLDNDGDLDIIVNNINEPATLLKNTAVEKNNGNFLWLKFKGPKTNPFGVGVKAKLVLNDSTVLTRQLINTRGFLSSVSNELHFGFAKNKNLDVLEIIWPDGKTQILKGLKVNKLMTIDYLEAKIEPIIIKEEDELFTKVETLSKHEDTYFNDYELQVLLPNKLSQTGPFVTKSDINNDGLTDLYIGGAKNQSGQLYLGDNNGMFTTKDVEAFKNDKHFEDQGALFVDVDNDGDKDLYVVSGSNEFYRNIEYLQDRIYINDGYGNFSREDSRLPKINASGSVVISGDYDNDGDLDLFVGGRLVPGKYPTAPISYILKNTNGVFEIVTQDIAPELETIGMITAATWVDINKDGLLDLTVTGEWMGIEVFENNGRKLLRKNKYKELSDLSGWWSSIVVEDVDLDGDLDIIAGNLGLNSKFHASKDDPFKIYTNDYDDNGSEDILLAKSYNGKEVPIRGKSCMTQQLPYLDKRIKSYHDFASRDLQEIIGKNLKESLHYKVVEFRSGIFINNGKGDFQFNPFEPTAQRAPINSIFYSDIDQDGFKDLILAGNNYMTEPETTRYDAGLSTYLKGKKGGEFSYLPNNISGLYIDGDTRDIISIQKSGKLFLIITNNNSTHDIYRYNH
ncbi:VCBS repeat-containing protein [Zobellia laminariae]|uniref:VCBS repeat-containing protein n=1 Tax=Zobellia laminariae TaxID=248906 RepID=UPI0012D99497|nr:RNA-binding protein [Zobellia laminariae]